MLRLEIMHCPAESCRWACGAVLPLVVLQYCSAVHHHCLVDLITHQLLQREPTTCNICGADWDGGLLGKATCMRYEPSKFSSLPQQCF